MIATAGAVIAAANALARLRQKEYEEEEEHEEEEEYEEEEDFDEEPRFLFDFKTMFGL